MNHLKFFFQILILIGGLVLSGCSSLFYYPTDFQHTDPAKMRVPPEEIWLTKDTGIKINGWYFRHGDSQSSKGLIVFFHGNGENMSSHYLSLMWILDRGYDFVIFDYEGYWKSQGEPSPKNTVEDGIMVLQWAHRKSLENPQNPLPLIVFGQSLGGAIALRAVIDIKDKIPIKLVVVDSTFHSYQTIARKALSKSFLTWLFQPLAYVLVSDRYAPGKDIKQISPTPLIVIHGDKDQTVDFELGQKVFDLAGEPKEFWHVEGGGHTDAFWGYKGRYRHQFLDALSRIAQPVSSPHKPNEAK